jgi:hypothetical protein
VISYSQACRRLNQLSLKLCDHRTDKNDVENIEISIDSTVIHVYHSAQHNKDNAKIRKYNGTVQLTLWRRNFLLNFSIPCI